MRRRVGSSSRGHTVYVGAHVRPGPPPGQGQRRLSGLTATDFTAGPDGPTGTVEENTGPLAW